MEQCLYTVVRATKNIETEIIVVDNNSSDGSFAFFQDRFAEVHFEWNSTNIGFARANNQAITLATGDYVLFLNPDTLVPEDCFEKCISFIKKHGDSIALGTRMVDGSGRFLKESKRAFPDPLTSLYKLTGLARLFPRSKMFGRYHLGHLPEHEEHPVDVLAGAFMMMPQRILDEVKGFDEDFFMYGEDIDLSYRVQKSGYRNFYFPQTTIVHFKGESTRKGSLNYVKIFYRAMMIFVNKHYGGPRAGVYRFLIHTAIFFRGAMAAVSRFLRWVGLPAIDAGIILGSFWLVKFLWSHYIKQEVNYSPNMMLVAFPFFTALFLLSSFFAGLYDGGYRQGRLNRATLVSLAIILSTYSLLPESLRFSRGILLFGTLTAFLFMTITRKLLVQWGIIATDNELPDLSETLLIGNEQECTQMQAMLTSANNAQETAGRAATLPPGRINKTLAEIRAINSVSNIRRIVFCIGQTPLSDIIQLVAHLPHGMRAWFFQPEANAIIGSHSKDMAGHITTSRQDCYHLNQAVYRRAKRSIDIGAALFLILTWPLQLLVKKRPVLLLKNAWLVLCGHRSWIGYAGNAEGLPRLRTGVIDTTGIALNERSVANVDRLDELYARQYRASSDLRLLIRCYRRLS